MCIFIEIVHMRTNIEIDDDLIKEAMRLTGIKTKKAVVEAALAQMLSLKNLDCK